MDEERSKKSSNDQGRLDIKISNILEEKKRILYNDTNLYERERIEREAFRSVLLSNL